jgi:hypothetical protein
MGNSLLVTIQTFPDNFARKGLKLVRTLFGTIASKTASAIASAVFRSGTNPFLGTNPWALKKLVLAKTEMHTTRLRMIFRNS